VAAVALQIGVLIPLLADNLAGFIPAEGERALGAATFGHIREALDETGLNPLAVCDTPEGGAALTDLVTRLGPDGGFDPAVTVAVLDHDMINAFALPGGFVVIFRGLIDAADGPDEVAAVLAHEIGHVVSRDPTRHALRSAGSIGVLGLLFGDLPAARRCCF
jgi:Zn-dependent protease with chaperone function